MDCKDFLIYLTVGYHPYFSRLTEFCIRTIRENNDMNRIDICVMCDEPYRKHVEDIQDVTFFETAPNPKPDIASMRKLEVFDIPNIMNYKKVLFLDSDIVVCGDLISTVFSNPLEDGILYTLEETFKEPHRSAFFSNFTYTEQDILRLNADGKRGFNCGQFVFAPTETMKQHFHNIRDMVRTHKGSYYYEQSFMNVYFNLNGCSDGTLLARFAKIYPNRDTFDPTKVIVHFNSDGTTDTVGRIKLQRMKAYYELCKKYIANKQ